MIWLKDGIEFNKIPENKYGFIYLITYKSGKKYIGKKSFFSFKILPPLKGNKRRRKVIRESNWKMYLGSSKEIPRTDKPIRKEILSLSNSKQHLSYEEEKYLFMFDVLFSDDYYNKNIAGKYFDNVDKVAGEYLKYKR